MHYQLNCFGVSMSLSCKIGIHSWDGCKCTKCSKIRDENHSWDGCKCSKCGKTKDENHSWDGCQCTNCGSISDKDHTWALKSCRCTKCGKDFENELVSFINSSEIRKATDISPYNLSGVEGRKDGKLHEAVRNNKIIIV